MVSKLLGTIMIVAVIGTLSAVAGASAFGGLIDEKPTVPRYSETCAHGHNSFDCKTPQYRVDIDDLQERVSALERHHKPSP